jgi:hypothetical protein
MNGRSWSEDFTLHAEEPMSRAHDFTSRSWSFCDDYSYHPPLNTIFGDHSTSYNSFDDVVTHPRLDCPQAKSMAEKCGYRTGKCFNMCALKRNGKFHKLCDLHRRKANLNQKRLDHKKRLRRFSLCDFPRFDVPHDPNGDGASTSTEQPAMNFNEISDASPSHIDEAPLDLRIDELDFFCTVMTSEKVIKRDERKCEPTQEHCRSEIDFSADLEMLFMSAMMQLVT